jgi:hypothetical protein
MTNLKTIKKTTPVQTGGRTVVSARVEGWFCAGALVLSTGIAAGSLVLAATVDPLWALGVIVASIVFKTGCLGWSGLQTLVGPQTAGEA